MKKALITGITGFAGSHLAEYLSSQNEYEINGIHSSDRNLDNLKKVKEKIHLFKTDLNDREKTAEVVKEIQPDVVFHLAASADVSKSFDNPMWVILNNSTVEFNILDAVKNLKSDTKVIVISSAQVYGYISSSDIPTDENVKFKPDNPYGVSKITQEYLALQYFYTYKIPTIILRPFNHVGPRLATNFVLSRFAKTIVEIEKGKHEPVLKVGNLEARRDFTDVRDMTRAYALSVNSCQPGEVYNIGTGVSYTISEMLDKLLAMSEVKITVESDDSLLRPSDNPELRSDSSKFIQATSWKPEISIDQTLRDLLAYWREIV